MTVLKTFKDFLKTGNDESDIRDKCAPFLAEAGGLPLYRGYGFKVGAILNGAREVPIRTDRKPRDSSDIVHGLMDTYFKNRFGVTVRSSGLFTTGNKATAARYGSPYYVFPVGDFSYIWGEYQGQPLVDSLRVSRAIMADIEVSPRDKADEITSKHMSMVKWHASNLQEALKNGAEIAVLAKSAIIVPVGKRPYEKLINP